LKIKYREWGLKGKRENEHTLGKEVCFLDEGETLHANSGGHAILIVA